MIRLLFPSSRPGGSCVRISERCCWPPFRARSVLSTMRSDCGPLPSAAALAGPASCTLLSSSSRAANVALRPAYSARRRRSSRALALSLPAAADERASATALAICCCHCSLPEVMRAISSIFQLFSASATAAAASCCHFARSCKCARCSSANSLFCLLTSASAAESSARNRGTWLSDANAPASARASARAFADSCFHCTSRAAIRAASPAFQIRSALASAAA